MPNSHDDFLTSPIGDVLISVLLEKSRFGMMLTDSDRKIVWVNHGFTALTGFALEEVRGKSPGVVLQGPDTDQATVTEMSEKLSAGVPFHVEVLNYTKDESPYWVRLDIEPLRDRTGEITHFLAMQTDITRQKEAEERSRRMDRLLETTARLTHVGGWELDLETSQPIWSDEVYRIHGVPIGQRLDLERALDFYPPEALPIIRAALERAIVEGEQWDLELPFVNAKGERLWIRTVGRPEVLDGKTVRLWGTFQDLTARWRAEEESRKLSKRLRLATQASGIGIWDWSIPDDMLVWDEQMYALYGVRASDFAGAYEAWEQGVHPDDTERAASEVGEALRGERPFNTTFRVVWPDGSIRFIRAMAMVERDNDGNPLRMIGTNWDITESHKAQIALKRAKEAAEAGIKARSRFLATMSHEIRTPLNGILGMVSLLKENPEIPDEPRELIGTIDESSAMLMNILNDVLDFSKIDAGQLHLEETPFDLRMVLDRVASICGASAREKGITLETVIDGACWVIGDPQRLTQVVLNLVNNAVKFTDDGGVVVRMSHRDMGARREIRVEVEDTGIGIPAAKQASLFTPFFQADSSTERRYGGTGLGLSICKRLIEMIGGEIACESEAGKGTKIWFTVSLPAGKPVTAPVDAVGGHNLPESLTVRNYLLVEDNPINQKVVAKCLSHLGIAVDVAENGAVAVDMARRVAYDYIFMDCNMPVMNGFEATRRIRRLETGHRDAVIIALTANAMKEDRESCLEAGMNDYMSKPVSVAKLRRLLSTYVS